MPELAPVRILYMEDDAGLARLLQKNLERSGYVVEIARNGEEGLMRCAEASWDLLIIDYNMPIHGGLEVIKILREQGKLIPSIMLTGAGDEQVAVDALKLGASDYMVKDLELRYLELLPIVIEQVMYKHRLMKEKDDLNRTIKENEERYRLLVDLMLDGIAICVNGVIVFINPAGTGLLKGEAPEKVTGRQLLDYIHPDGRAAAREKMAGIAANEVHGWTEMRFVCLDGSEIEVEVAGVPFHYEGKAAIQFIFRDISERKLAEKKLEHLALFDPLTDLPNRTMFFSRLDQAILDSQREEWRFAVLFLDLDHFKEANDQYGHALGDLLLKQVAGRLENCLREFDLVARFGGDEFAAIVTRVSAPDKVEAVSQRILDALSRPFSIEGHSCSIGASIGISLYPDDGCDAETLIRNADSVMYKVKEEGRNGYRFFNEKHYESEKWRRIGGGGR